MFSSPKCAEPTFQINSLVVSGEATLTADSSVKLLDGRLSVPNPARAYSDPHTPTLASWWGQLHSTLAVGFQLDFGPFRPCVWLDSLH